MWSAKLPLECQIDFFNKNFCSIQKKNPKMAANLRLNTEIELNRCHNFGIWCSQNQMKLPGTYYILPQKISMCKVSDIDWFKQSSEHVCIAMCHYARDWTQITISRSSRDVENCFMSWYIGCFQVLRSSDMGKSLRQHHYL